MNPHDSDPDESVLERLFTARERRDEAAAPSFARGLRRPARGVRGWRWVPATVGLLLLALIVAGIVGRRHLEPAAPAPTLATWKAPTDFLLNVPGGELLDSTPAFPSPNLPLPAAANSQPRRL
jgi:hypothetical protein